MPSSRPQSHDLAGHAHEPADYLVWSILATVLCCLPLGVVSIVFAAQSRSQWAAGQRAEAHASAAKAKTFAAWSAGVTLVGWAAYLLFLMVLVGAS